MLSDNLLAWVQIMCLVCRICYGSGHGPMASNVSKTCSASLRLRDYSGGDILLVVVVQLRATDEFLRHQIYEHANVIVVD